MKELDDLRTLNEEYKKWIDLSFNLSDLGYEKAADKAKLRAHVCRDDMAQVAKRWEEKMG